MKKTKRIAIVGAGIAGIALAIHASKQGYQVSLYERDPKISSIGAGITLWPNAVFVLQQMGLEDELRKLAGSPRFMRQLDQHGRIQGELDIAEMDVLSGFSSLTILRRDLIKVLSKALDHCDVDTHFGYSMTTYDIDVLKREFDLVVGADGRMNSVVREALYAKSTEHVTPCYQGFINIIGVSQLEPNVLENVVQDFRGIGERFGIVPIKSGLCYWAAAWNTGIDRTRPLSEWREELHLRFKDWPEPVQTVLGSYDSDSLNRIFVHDLDPLPYWHRDNVLMIGDAAHAPLPTSGQGACQALEDVWHLVRLLEDGGALETVLTAFYQQRIVKTTTAQSVGRQLAKRIFSVSSFVDHEPEFSFKNVSAKSLSQLWMQGLDAL